VAPTTRSGLTSTWPGAGQVWRHPGAQIATPADHRTAVCDGKVKLRATQEAIAQNWLTAEAELGPGGSP
jgi:hypothetical protein